VEIFKDEYWDLKKLGSILVSWAAVTNYHSLGGLKQEKFILSRLWMLEV
jgi:hypothetical protein